MKRSRLILTLVFIAALNWISAAESGPSKKSKKGAKPAPLAEIDFSAPPQSSVADPAAPDKPLIPKGTGDTTKFAELQFEKTLIIEAKVERPQVQFPLLKEPPPEKDIPFEASFREELLKQPRENTFQQE